MRTDTSSGPDSPDEPGPRATFAPGAERSDGASREDERQRLVEELRRMAGTLDLDLTVEELLRQRGTR